MRGRVKDPDTPPRRLIRRCRALAQLGGTEPDSFLGGSLVLGPDDRGVVLEVIGIQLPDYLLIIHVMPYAYRRSQQ